MPPQWLDMALVPRSMYVPANSGSTNLRSSKAALILFQYVSVFWFAPVIGSMLTSFHASARHTSSTDVHLMRGSPGLPLADLVFLFFFPLPFAGAGTSSSSSISSSCSSSTSSSGSTSASSMSPVSSACAPNPGHEAAVVEPVLIMSSISASALPYCGAGAKGRGPRRAVADEPEYVGEGT